MPCSRTLEPTKTTPLLPLLLLAACAAASGGPDASRAPDGSALDAGAPPDARPGPDGAVADTGGPPDASPAADAGLSLRDRVQSGPARPETSPRPGYGVLAIQGAGERLAFLEVLRRSDGTHLRRVRTPGFTREEADGEVFHDLALHPSGDVTVALEDTRAATDGYALVRLSADGVELGRQVLPVGATLPPADRGDLPPTLWMLRARPAYPLLAGWVRLAARAEDVVLTFLSRVRPEANELVSAVALAHWTGAGYEERFTRIVDGRHLAEPPAWQYDELRFADALVRPLLAVDEVDGTIVVGRTWTQSRCRAVRAVFGGLDPSECAERTTPNVESRALTFAFTAFSPAGERLATRSFVPRDGYYFALFGLAARGGSVALAGTTSVQTEDGTVRFYDGDRIPFDGLVAVLDRASGAVRWERHVDRGRADLFAAIRWPAGGLVAVGITDWDRWDGGMSISRGGDPWLAYLDARDGEVATRVLERPGTDRHAYLLDLVVTPSGRVVSGGLDDAPLTHSGDGPRLEAMTFGGLVVTLGD